MKHTTYEELLKWAAGRCASKEYCCFDMYEKLLTKGANSELSQKVVEKLVEKKFIDDERFAKAYVNDKITYNNWGKLKCKYMLHQKSIEESIIQQALDSIDMEVYRNVLHDVLLSKIQSINADNDYQLAQKLLKFATGRGFEADLVFEIVGSL